MSPVRSNRNEGGGGDLTPCRVVPAQQGFEAGDGLAADVLLRLIHQPQLPARDCETEVVFQQPALANLRVIEEFSEYKKFSVETTIRVTGENLP